MHEEADKGAGFADSQLESHQSCQKIQNLQINKDLNVNHRVSSRVQQCQTERLQLASDYSQAA
jgi:hypothetical protein